MNTKRKGSRNEWKSIRLLQARGYACTKSAASLGLFDIIAVGPNDVLLVQVKSNKRPRKAEMARLHAFVHGPFVHKIIHVWKDYAKEPEVEILLPHEDLKQEGKG